MNDIFDQLEDRIAKLDTLIYVDERNEEYNSIVEDIEEALVNYDITNDEYEALYAMLVEGGV